MAEKRRIALAYSGGLDTSAAVPWLIENYEADVVCVAVDVGQGPDELDGIRERARAAGATECRVVDGRRSFVEGFVWPTLQAGAVYARKYLLGTAMARPLVAREVVRVAREVGAKAVAHGCTGKGNDQLRFELAFAWLAPELKVIAPWREWSFRGRREALEYASARGVPLPCPDSRLYSRDRNLWHVSHEGGPLEDPAFEPKPCMYLVTADPEHAPEVGESVEIGFELGVPVSVDGARLEPVALLTRLNAVAGRHGVGRTDVIEDRVVGLKSRGVYETPGGTLLYLAHRELEQLVLDRGTLELKDALAARYASLVYEGRWWGTEREALDALVGVTQRLVTGSVTLGLYRGTCRIVGRSARASLYNQELATFETSDLYDHADAAGFIRLFGLPYRTAGRRRGRDAPSADGEIAGLRAPGVPSSAGEGPALPVAGSPASERRPASLRRAAAG
ncbi:MAG: argininosuccinate synthase [Gemmatimonadota bacterium]